MDLRALLAEVETPSVAGDAHRTIEGIAHDSREVRPGFLFAALRGLTHDGHDFVGDAAARGAIAVMVDRPISTTAGLTVVRVADSRRALGQASAAFYGHPSRRLTTIGVTGTNGKGATTFLVDAILRRAGRPCGIIGTMGMVVGGTIEPTDRTTPEAPALQRSLRTMVDRGCRYAAVEVASHALAMERVAGCRFDVGVFTNLTRDHLDFHKSMEAYLAAKSRLFAGLSDDAWAVLNADDPASAVLRLVTRARVMSYGLRGHADVRGRDVRLHLRGAEFMAETPAGAARVTLRLAGEFNVANALAAFAVGLTQGIALDVIAEALASMPGIPGRFESVDEGQPFAVIVDYAHTPDGLENVLRTARQITSGRVIVVFGCGGDRDRTKRPIMGRIAAELADHVIVTSDNPRSEAPRAIIDEITPGVAVGGEGRRIAVVVEPDRRRAIGLAVGAASSGDLVLIAGKGHESYQEIAGVRQAFDDRDVVREALRAAHAGAPARGPRSTTGGAGAL